MAATDPAVDVERAMAVFPLFERLRNAKQYVEQCRRFCADAQIELNEALLELGRAKDAWDAWADENGLEGVL